MDDRERDKFYSSASDEEDGAELELEPPDPEILATEQRRARDAIENTRMSIDIDEIYRDVERDRGREILEGWFRNLSLRFQVKHLLIATAALAILLTLAKLNLMVLVVIGIMLSIAGLFLYLQWQEKKQQDEANRRRQEMYARRRAKFGKAAAPGDDAAEAGGSVPEPLPPLQSEVDEIWEKANRENSPFQLRFSLRQFLLAMTVAAIILGLAQFLGANNAATLLGLVALFGLIVHALGFEPGQVVVLGWWLILVMYVLLSITGTLLSLVK